MIWPCLSPNPVAVRAGPTLEGYAVSPGQVTAPASVISSPKDFDKMAPDSILVCTTTTPAWTPLFAQAKGLVTDIGGALAHGSIVAREYGIPAVMGTGVATQRIEQWSAHPGRWRPRYRDAGRRNRPAGRRANRSSANGRATSRRQETKSDSHPGRRGVCCAGRLVAKTPQTTGEVRPLGFRNPKGLVAKQIVRSCPRRSQAHLRSRLGPRRSRVSEKPQVTLEHGSRPIAAVEPALGQLGGSHVAGDDSSNGQQVERWQRLEAQQAGQRRVGQQPA